MFLGSWVNLEIGVNLFGAKSKTIEQCFFLGFEHMHFLYWTSCFGAVGFPGLLLWLGGEVQGFLEEGPE